MGRGIHLLPESPYVFFYFKYKSNLRFVKIYFNYESQSDLRLVCMAIHPAD